MMNSTAVPDAMPPPGRTVHVAWASFQRRQVSMAPLCGFEVAFMPLDKSLSRWRKAWAYLRLGVQTWRKLRAERPQTVWVQLPQVPLLWVALAYRAMSGSRVRVVADCHNMQLRPPWATLPLARWALRRADAVLVHNVDMERKAALLGWRMSRVVVMEDVPPVGMDTAPKGLARQQLPAPRPWVVFPGSFAADEPITELLQAARLAPGLSFIITGRTQNAARHGHDLSALPANVWTPGFLPVEVFDDLLREADCVLALTREEGIQLSVCNEALGFGKSLVVSDTALLRRLFADAAVMVDSREPAAIVAGCRQALAEQDQRGPLSRELAARRLTSWVEGPWTQLCALLGRRE